MVNFCEIIVPADDTGRRLDRFLRAYFKDLTQGEIEKLLRSKMIRLDGLKAKSDSRILEGAVIRYPDFLAINDTNDMPYRKNTFPQEIILYQDDDVMVINKPAGLASQGGSGLKVHLDMMLDTLPQKNGYRPSTVHRLDKDTSGCLVIAKKRSIAASLGEGLKNREFEKYYLAITDNIPMKNAGIIESYLMKSTNGQRDLMQSFSQSVKGSQFAQSCYYTLESRHKKALLLMTPITGRTHQLRVHCRDMNCPVIGDPKYNDQYDDTMQLCLHAAKLVFNHPKTGKTLEIDAPIPEYFTKIMKTYELDLKNPVSYENKEILNHIMKQK